MKQILSYLIFSLSFILQGQTIYKSSIDSGGDTSSNGNIQIMYTIGEVNVQEYSVGNIILSEGFVSKAFEVLIDTQVFLQGPLLNPVTPGLMNDDLRVLSYLPTTSPYGDGTTVAASVFNLGGTSGSGLAQDDIVDWVWVELRGANNNATLINEKSALLQRDGDIVALDGVSGLVMTAAPTGYYVVVKHRNHLGAMTSATIGLVEASVTAVDFKSNGVATFGSNARVDLGSGVMALWAGDTNNGDQIKFSGSNNNSNIIKDFILADSANVLNFITFGSSGYLDIDVNLNGFGKFSGSGNDSNILKDNVLAHPGNVLNFITYTISTTVPSKN
jgi:hypothetical protein